MTPGSEIEELGVLVFEKASAQCGIPMPEAVFRRVAVEMVAIQAMDAAGIFLALRRMVECAKRMRLLIGPGRGALAGSLTLFLTGVTGINPLKHGLQFEPALEVLSGHQHGIFIDFGGGSCNGDIFEDVLAREVPGDICIRLNRSGELDVIARSRGEIFKRNGSRPKPFAIADGDAETLSFLSSGKPLPVKGGESGLQSPVMDLLALLQPESLGQMAALFSLARPQALEHGMLQEYISRKNCRCEASRVHPALAPYFSETFGMALYHEQITAALCGTGGFSVMESEKIRKALCDGRSPESEIRKAKFIEQASSVLGSELDACSVLLQLEVYAGLTFRKAHALSYSMILYRLAYLYVHFRDVYMACIE